MSKINSDGAAFWENAKKSMPADIVAKIDAGIEAMVNGETPYKPVEVGDRISDFSLKNQHGEERSLSSILNNGPAIVFFYRGEWCPFCNLQLKHYQESLDAFKAAGATLVAISPEKPDYALVASEKNNLDFDILFDAEDGVGEAFGVSVCVPDEHIEVLSGFDVSLPDRNGTDGWSLPVPGVFIIGQDFLVKWRFIDANYRVRAEVDQILNALRSVQAKVEME